MFRVSISIDSLPNSTQRSNEEDCQVEVSNTENDYEVERQESVDEDEYYKLIDLQIECLHSKSKENSSNEVSFNEEGIIGTSFLHSKL